MDISKIVCKNDVQTHISHKWTLILGDDLRKKHVTNKHAKIKAFKSQILSHNFESQN